MSKSRTVYQHNVHKFQRPLLNLEISDAHVTIIKYQNILLSLENDISIELPVEVSKKFFDTQHLKLEPAFNAYKAANINKLANLINNKKRPTSNPIDSTFENWIVNLSNTEIPVNVTDVLKMGPKYGIPFKPHCIPTNKLISDFESKISFIPSDCRNTARQDFTNTIKKFINTPSPLHADKNILYKIKETKIFQNNNQDLLFLKADKGNTTVVMNKQMYEDKMLQQLSNNNSYKVVRYDLTCTLQQEVKKLTTDWSKSKLISDQLRRQIAKTDCLPPRAYGLPKIHKPDTPAAIFKFNQNIYAQTYGLPMGSPLSPILSDLVLDDLEQYCLNKLDFKPSFYFRYVDDIVTAVPSDKVAEMLSVFNSFHPRLQFTSELESNHRISFLDVLIINDNQFIKTDWFHKATWSQRYLNYHSHHPRSYKIGTINCLVDRAIRLSSMEFHKKNLSLIQQVLSKNDYPPRLLNKHIQFKYDSILSSTSPNNNIDATTAQTNQKNYISIPYVAGLFESLNRTFSKYKIQFVGKCAHDLSSMFDSGKDPLPPGMRSGVVYKIPCSQCNMSYIGQTSRQLHTRITEHKRNIHEHEDNYTALTRHAIDFDHSFNYSQASIIDVEPLYYNRLLLEMCNIVAHPNSVNRKQDIEHLSNIYTSVIRPM
ncbi:uncharacterized protein [Neodiprion pinetum]|uniref:uncharacterized protein n=1 Tax=Neodiprion pinetum TaxID=441929 RepID=UPI001EE0F93F|nr:uncharacterized protein LOC124223300 [Neodiprion pinetum]